MPEPSPRARVALAIEAHLRAHRDCWNARIVPELRRFERGGGVRIVHFGQEPHSGLAAWVWSPERIELQGQGPLAHALRGFYANLEEVLLALTGVELGEPQPFEFPPPRDGETYTHEEEEALFLRHLRDQVGM